MYCPAEAIRVPWTGTRTARPRVSSCAILPAQRFRNRSTSGRHIDRDPPRLIAREVRLVQHEHSKVDHSNRIAAATATMMVPIIKSKA